MSLERRIELIEKKASRVEEEITTHDFQIDNEEISDSFKKSIGEVMSKLHKVRKMRKSLAKKEEKQEEQRLRKQLNIKLDKINQLLKKEIEDHFYLIEMAESQKDSEEYKRASNFIEEVGSQYGIDSDPLMVFKDRYLAYNSTSLNEVSKSVLICPYFEKQNYLYYPMLVHELGHTFTYENISEVFSEFTEKMADEKEILEEKELKDERRKGELNHFTSCWDEWKHEFAADLFAAEILGKAYYTALFYFLNGDPYDINITHPPHAMRLEAVAKYCGIKDRKLEKMQEEFDKDPRYDSLKRENLVEAIGNQIHDLLSDAQSDSDMSVIHAEEAIEDPQENYETKDIVPLMKGGWELVEDDHQIDTVNRSLRQALDS